MKTPDSSTSARRSFSAGSRPAYCALTSTSGIWGTAAQSRRADAADYDVGHENHDRGDDRVLGVAEVVVEALVARSERPPGGGQPEAPRYAAEEGEDGEARHGHARDSGRDRDEGANDGRDAAEEDGGVAE